MFLNMIHPWSALGTGGGGGMDAGQQRGCRAARCQGQAAVACSLNKCKQSADHFNGNQYKSNNVSNLLQVLYFLTGPYCRTIFLDENHLFCITKFRARICYFGL
jgi:hypothetical protein